MIINYLEFLLKVIVIIAYVRLLFFSSFLLQILSKKSLKTFHDISIQRKYPAEYSNLKLLFKYFVLRIFIQSI